MDGATLPTDPNEVSRLREQVRRNLENADLAHVPGLRFEDSEEEEDLAAERMKYGHPDFDK